MNEKFHSSSFKDPINRDEVEFTDKGVTFRVRKLIGGTDNFVFYSDISGVEIDNGVFFATVRVIPRARPEIVISNFTKGDARRIKDAIDGDWHIETRPSYTTGAPTDIDEDWEATDACWTVPAGATHVFFSVYDDMFLDNTDALVNGEAFGVAVSER